MKQKTIPFFNTMTSRKRGEGAYLRKNILSSDEEGLYPSVDFQNKTFAGTADRDRGYMLINDYVFVEEGGVSKVYQHSGSGDLVFKLNMPDASDVVAVTGTDINNKVLVLLDNGKLFTVQNTVAVEIHAFGESAVSSFMVYNGFFYFISIGTVLHRMNPDFSAPTVVKNTTAESQSEIINMQIWNDYIVMTRSLGRFVQFDFWSITTGSLDTYQKRVVEYNCRHLACGSVDGVLLFVKSVGNSANQKEKEGDIVITAFDGEKFKKLNSIRAGDKEVLVQANQSQSIGNGVMILTVQNNSNDSTDTLFKNWVFKIRNTGSVETLFEPNDIDTGDEVVAINVEYSYLSMLFKKLDGQTYYYHTNDLETGYKRYTNFNTSEYVTNFLNNNMNVHELVSFGVSFEKGV